MRGLIVFNRSAHLDNETGNSPDDFLRIVTPAIVGRANVNYVLGTSGRNAITGTNGADYFDLSLGGDDIVDGLDGDDGFFFGAAFTAGDQVEGGAGTNDQIGLDGDYTVTLGGNFSNVEVVVLMRGPAGSPNDFAITAANSLVASGQTLAIFGLQVETSITFDGAAESDGNLRIYGGTIDDTLIAGGGADWIFGGAGADTLSGGGGNDIFHYDDVAQSTADLGDTILDFASGDNIDVSGIDADRRRRRRRVHLPRFRRFHQSGRAASPRATGRRLLPAPGRHERRRPRGLPAGVQRQRRAPDHRRRLHALAADRNKEEDVEIAGRSPVAVADLELGRRDAADALAAEADQHIRVALVDDEAEVADRRTPVGAGDEDVAQPGLGQRDPVVLVAPADALGRAARKSSSTQ